jgi:ubiquinone/menaquinone biosynthesis C-methylase UbiE
MSAMLRPVDPARARGFDAWAGEYDRYRPGYPEELFLTIAERLSLPQPPLVVDLGAGTGRASLAMAELGWRVTAIEPGRPMLDVLLGRATDDGLVLAMVQASAEETGLDPASADLVTAAQAFHWFDQPRALTEMARITKPGGGVALFWNVRDAGRSPFLAAYAELLKRATDSTEDPGIGRYESGGREETRRALSASKAFDAPELVELQHEVLMTPDEFMGMAFTASYVRVGLTPDGQARFRADLEGLLERHGQGADRAFPVPYRIDLWIARRRGA